MKKAISEVEGKIKKILAEKNLELEELNKKLEEGINLKKKAEKDMLTYTSQCNVNAYVKAKEESARADTIIEMYMKRINVLSSKRLVTQEEYEKGVSQILNSLKDASAEARNKVIDHMEQIKLIAGECAEEIKKGNSVLKEWQHEVYRDNAEIITANGEKHHSNSLEKQFKDYSVYQFADFALGCGFYKELLEKQER